MRLTPACSGWAGSPGTAHPPASAAWATACSRTMLCLRTACWLTPPATWSTGPAGSRPACSSCFNPLRGGPVVALQSRGVPCAQGRAGSPERHPLELWQPGHDVHGNAGAGATVQKCCPAQVPCQAGAGNEHAASAVRPAAAPPPPPPKTKRRRGSLVTASFVASPPCPCICSQRPSQNLLCWWRRSLLPCKPCPGIPAAATCPDVAIFSLRDLPDGLQYIPGTGTIRGVVAIMEMCEEGPPVIMSAVQEGLARIPFNQLQYADNVSAKFRFFKDRMLWQINPGAIAFTPVVYALAIVPQNKTLLQLELLKFEPAHSTAHIPAFGPGVCPVDLVTCQKHQASPDAHTCHDGNQCCF